MIWWPLIALGGIAVEFGLGFYDEFKRTQSAQKRASDNADECAADAVLPVEITEARNLTRRSEVSPFLSYLHGQTQSWWERVSTIFRASYYNIVTANDQRLMSSESHAEQSDALSRLGALVKWLTGEIEHNSPQSVHKKLAFAVGALTLTTLGWIEALPLLTVAALPIMLYLSLPFLLASYDELMRKRTISVNLMDVMIIITLLAMRHVFLLSVYFSVYYGSKTLLLKTQNTAQKRLRSLVGALPPAVWVELDGVEVSVPFTQVQRGDIVVVHAGEVIPIDGVVTAGSGSVDQHQLTGEAQPVEKTVGEPVLAFTVLLMGRIRIRVETAGNETVAANIATVLERTANYTFSLQTRGEAVMNRCALPNVALWGMTWPLLGASSATAALYAIPGYSLRIVAPLNVLNFLNIASKRSILVKDGRALEELRKVDMVVFDKTGTLTHDQPCVTAIYPCSDYTTDDVLRYAATAEFRQTHPSARAILQKAHTHHLTTHVGEDALYEIGYGISVTLADLRIQVGSERFMEMMQVAIPAAIHAIRATCDEQGASLVYVALNGTLAGAIELRPTIRAEVPQIIAALRRRGVQMAILSGDHAQPTAQLARELGIDRYFADTLPQQKAALIKQLQDEGRTVCFVGDGINDAIALKQANVSVSLRGATTIATDTAQIVLSDARLHHLPDVFDIAHALDDNMHTLFELSIVPGIITIGGIYLLHFGLLNAIVIYNIGLFSGIGLALWPAISPRWKTPAALPPAQMEQK